MRATMLTVYITVLILVLKVFDIVYVTTNGNFNTNVIANLFFQKLFADQQAGQAAAIVVILLIAVMPILIYQVRSFRREELERARLFGILPLLVAALESWHCGPLVL